MYRNILLNTDSYKFSHYLQYPPGTEYVHSYIESRGGKYPASLFFGLQYILKEFLSKPFTQEDIDEAERIVTAHGEPFNREGFMYILNKHNGYFPVEIRSVQEGCLVPVNNVLVTVENTDPKCFWVTSFLETLLMRLWYPVTVATREFYLRKKIREYLKLTADDSAMEGLGFKLNDFGSRGASSEETSAIGGMAHLVSFLGTDNVPALEAAIRYYGVVEPMGFSIPAAEHSTMTSWGGKAGEIHAMRNMLTKFAKPGTLVAVVSDSYDIWNAIKNYWGGSLLEEVKNSGATIVVRPDSGDPVETSVGVITELMHKVGSTINTKGYRLLPSYFRVIQGDGVNEDSIEKILIALESKGISTDNIAFGMGGAMLQQMDRDTMKFAMKCSAICVSGEWRDVYKEPITDSGKVSKRGRLKLIKDAGEYKTVSLYDGWRDYGHDAMQLVYRNGKTFNDSTFNYVRKVANEQ